MKKLLFLIVGIIVVNIVAQTYYKQVDLTEDKRYSLSSPVINELESLESPVSIRVFMTAEFLPADFKLFKKSITEKLEQFQSYSNKINFFYEDINEGTIEEVRGRGMALKQMGVNPVRVGKDQQGKDVYVFPAALFEGKDTILINLMENEIPGQDEKTVIANSVSMLEYNIARGISQANRKETGIIAFTEGRGELDAQEVYDIDRTLRMNGYAVGRLPFDSISIIDNKIDVLIIAKPRLEFQEKDKFLIDQYIMNGGKVIWLIDRLTASLDSMLLMNQYTPYDYPLGIEDQLFKYGFRIQPNLIMDLECTSVRLVTGNMGDASQMDNFPWYFHPAVRPFSNNPIVKNLDRVNLQFASVIDTIATKKAKTKKTILLKTSDKTMLKYSPVDLNFEFLREEPDPQYFNKGNLPVAVLSEGIFSSAYEFNATSDMLDLLKNKGMEHKKRSEPTKMLVVSDGDIIRNEFDTKSGNIRALGFDRVSGYSFANKDFLMNTIEYMLNDDGIIQAKNKEVKLNLMDCTKAKNEKIKWQFVNIGLPIIFLAIFGFFYYFIRKRRFG